MSRAGYSLFPVRRRSKIPRDRGWQSRAYDAEELETWFRAGGNIGVQLSAEDLVLDVDPRHGGLASIDNLQSKLSINLKDLPAVISGRGDGGRHIYLRKPETTRVRKVVPGYSGLDLKTGGGFVLAPASVHPQTGEMYRPDQDARSIDQVEDCPPELLEIILKPSIKLTARAGGGELSVDELEMLLSVLDPARYGQGQYERWFKLGAACHDATNGAGEEAWLAWAAGDPNYGTQADDERNHAMWDALTAGKAGGVTYLHLLSEVARIGRMDLVRKVDRHFVFAPELDPQRRANREQADRAAAPIIDTASQRRSAPILLSKFTKRKQ
jgi:hypothetical protein